LQKYTSGVIPIYGVSTFWIQEWTWMPADFLAISRGCQQSNAGDLGMFGLGIEQFVLLFASDDFLPCIQDRDTP
jgi:hypothetical protein